MRDAKNIAARLGECSQLFGKVEHIVVSLPMHDYGLSVEASRLKAAKILRSRGVIGGVMIYHAFRYRNRGVLLRGVFSPKGWYFSPHYHVLGYLLVGYAKCRHCKKVEKAGYISREVCAGCNGFEARTRRLYDKDKYIVKVLAERITPVGTAWYQLSHSSIKVGVKRFHVSTWFGSCSYRKLKVTPKIKKDVCPICGEELERLRYSGKKSFICDRTAEGYKQDTFEDLCEDGVVVWSICEPVRR